VKSNLQPDLREENTSWQVKTCFSLYKKRIRGIFWNLDIVCYLLFGAWNFLNSKPAPSSWL
jgi:hypothetical protein